MSHGMVSNQEDITAPIEDTSPQQKAQRQFSATKNRLPQFRRLLQCKSSGQPLVRNFQQKL